MTLGYVSDKLFQNTDSNTSRVGEPHVVIFLLGEKKNQLFLQSVLGRSKLNFKCKFVQWHFNIFSNISCKLVTVLEEIENGCMICP